MIISHIHKFVYIAIPRTASKSMSEWLVQWFNGEWYGFHHQWRVPEAYSDYLIFTMVRNPYERELSAWFFQSKMDDDPPPPRDPSEFVEVTSELYLQGDCTVLIEGHNVPEVRMNQAHWVKKAGISLVLHYERLPECLIDLPFVKPEDIPSFPRVSERGQRPEHDFFAVFPAPQAEVNVWKYAKDDFEMFGYERYRTDLRNPTQPRGAGDV